MNELQRIASVYHAYEHGPAQARWSIDNPGNRAVLAERTALLRRALAQNGFFPLTARRILDVGCGRGELLGALASWGARGHNLFGIDLLPERIEAARRRFPTFHFACGNAESLPFSDESFDLVAAFTVFSSILDPALAGRIGCEMMRVLKTNGALLWYDFRVNNPRNPHVRGVGRRRIRSLLPRCRGRLQSVTMLPPLARRLGPWTDRMYPCLARIPWLRTHNLGVLLKSQ